MLDYASRAWPFSKTHFGYLDRALKNMSRMQPALLQGYFYAWSRGGIFASLNYTLVMASREAAGREASPTAGVTASR
jgi:hypothetical protein